MLAEATASTGFARGSCPQMCQETTSSCSLELRAHIGVFEPETQKQDLLGRLHRAGSEWLLTETSLTPVPLSALEPKEVAFPEVPRSHPSLLAEAFLSM